MKITCDGETLSVSGLNALAASNGLAITEQMDAAMHDRVNRVNIDLSETAFADCGGLGALIAFRKSARYRNRDVQIYLLNPTLSVRRLFHLTRINCLFSVDRQAEAV